jgi:transposase
MRVVPERPPPARRTRRSQALALFDLYTEQITRCDAQIEAYLRAMEPRVEGEPCLPDVPGKKRNYRSRNRLSFNAQAEFVRIVGVDLVAVTGRGEASVQTILSEIGTDMTRFPSSKHFCSWLGLAPHNDISAGKVLRSRTGTVVSRANQAFRQAAQAVVWSDSTFGADYRIDAGTPQATAGDCRHSA